MSNYHNFHKVEDVNPIIHHYSSDNTLSELLNQDFQLKNVRGAQWFRIADLWYRVNYGYNNPLNLGIIHSELNLINSQATILSEFLRDRIIVFYGVGVGDTEMALIDCQLNLSLYSEMILIDINHVFLEMFVRSLRNKKFENTKYDFNYLALQCLFENISHKHVQVENATYKKKAIICLGSTIGNVSDPREMFEMFNLIAKKGDLILLGYQLNTHLEKLFLKYKDNVLFNDLVGNYLKNVDRQRIVWQLNKASSTVEAWLDDIQIFRSKKFSPLEIREKALCVNWDEAHCVIDQYNNFCFHVFEVR